MFGIDLENLIKTGGLVAVSGIVFAESGLFFGFFLPGDSLLFTAGVLAARDYLPFFPLVLCAFVAAVLGDNVGYWFGKKVGPKIFNREDSLLFKKHHLQQAKAFYEKHGSKTIVLARFVPFVRTFAPIVAGAAEMDYKTFMVYNLLGGLLWGVGLTSLGYFLGNISWVHDNYEMAILVIVVGSLVPVVVHFVKDFSSRRRTSG